MAINGIPFLLGECSFQSISHETTDRVYYSICGWGDFAVVWLQYVHSENEKVPNLSLFSSQSLFCVSSVDSEVLSGAGRPVGGAGPEGDPVLCCLQLLGHCSVDQRWSGSGHRRGPPGWDIIQPPQASFSLFSMWLRWGFQSWF